MSAADARATGSRSPARKAVASLATTAFLALPADVCGAGLQPCVQSRSTARADVCGAGLQPCAPSQSAAPSAGASLAEADAALAAGRFAEAAGHYEAWLAARPESAEVLLALGACYVQLGRTEEAARVLRRHVRLAPDSATGHAALGIALLGAAAPAEAKAALERALALDPRQANAIEALARIHLVEGHPAAAVALLRPLVDGASESVQPAVSPAAVATAVGNPSSLEALYAEARIRSGDAAGAAVALERQLAANRRAPVQTYVLAGWARIKTGDLDKAAEICEEGMRTHPDSEIESVYLSLPAPLLARRTAERLERLRGAPDVNEMIALGRVLTDADPHRKTRALQIATRLLEDAVSLAPHNPSAHYNYGRALRDTRIQDALAAWEKALTLEPDDPLALQIHTQIGIAKDKLSDFEGAARAYESALAINRRLSERVPEAALEYVRSLQLQSKPDRAQAVLDEVLGWNPWSPHARAEQARLLAERGDWPGVVREAEFVLRSAGENAKLLRAAHALLVRAYHRLGQPAKAQAHRAWLDAR